MVIRNETSVEPVNLKPLLWASQLKKQSVNTVFYNMKQGELTAIKNSSTRASHLDLAEEYIHWSFLCGCPRAMRANKRYTKRQRQMQNLARRSTWRREARGRKRVGSSGKT
jgi:hypothetical protein